MALVICVGLVSAAFGVKGLKEIPAPYRLEAARCVELFDAWALPLEKVREWCGMAQREAKGAGA